MKFSEYIEETGAFKNLDQNDEYVCDSCKGFFRVGDVLLKKEPSNISITPHPMMGSIYTIMYNNEPYHLHCPLCEMIHLFGFNKEGVSTTKVKN